MLEHPVTYDAFVLPGPAHLPTDEALTIGLNWLLSQPGEPLIVLARRATSPTTGSSSRP
jgi:hypothetical protein